MHIYTNHIHLKKNLHHGGHFNKKLPLYTGAIKKVYEDEVLYSAFPIKQPLQEQHLASFLT